MAFYYNAELSTSTRDLIRFHLEDIAEDNGPLPDGGNFSNEELDALLTMYTDWECVVAAGFERLASAWASKPVFGPGELSTIHVDTGRKYERLAAAWRERCVNASAGEGLGYAEIVDTSGRPTGESYEPIFTRADFGLERGARR